MSGVNAIKYKKILKNLCVRVKKMSLRMCCVSAVTRLDNDTLLLCALSLPAEDEFGGDAVGLLLSPV